MVGEGLVTRQLVGLQETVASCLSVSIPSCTISEDDATLLFQRVESEPYSRAKTRDGDSTYAGSLGVSYS